MAAEYDLVVGSLDVGNGHVDNTVYPTYVATVRERFLREHVGETIDDLVRSVVRLEIDFHAELFPGDRLRATVAVEELGTTSVTTLVELSTGGEPVATARTVQVAVDPETRESVTLPDDWREGLAP